ncbi:MAG: sulfurtransferase [Balneolaceae bacterium]
MIHRLSVIILLFLIAGCTAEQNHLLESYPNAHLLVDAAALEQELQDGDLFLIDTRPSIENGVIPGAVHFPAVSSLSDPDHEIEHFLVDVESFEQMMQEIGLNNDDRVILYDDGNALSAARLFYALDYYGFGNASILNGGLQGWLADGYSTDEEPQPTTRGSFSVSVQENLSCDITYLRSVIDDPNVIVFDARSEGEFTGTDRRALKGGHIPNAVNLEWNSVLEQDGVPYFRSAAAIQAQYLAMGITPDKEVIPHCHTNVRGSHAYFTLRLMGYDSVRPYEGSWSEYGNLEDSVVM